jgi:hypothetical protein
MFMKKLNTLLLPKKIYIYIYFHGHNMSVHNSDNEELEVVDINNPEAGTSMVCKPIGDNITTSKRIWDTGGHSPDEISPVRRNTALFEGGLQFSSIQGDCLGSPITTPGPIRDVHSILSSAF